MSVFLSSNVRGALAACVAAASFLGAPAAYAELLDARILTTGGEAQLWLAFSDQPHVLETRVSMGGLEVHVDGVSAPARRIEPAGAGPVRAIQIQPGADSLSILLAGRWTGARAEARLGGVLVTLEGVTPAPQAAPAASRPAPPAVAPRPERPPAPDVSQPAPAPSMTPSPAPSSPSRPAPSDPARSTPPETLRPSVARAPVAADLPRICPAESAAVDADPWNMQALLAQARCFADSGEEASAALVLERILAFQPDQFDAALELGRIRESQGDAAAAQALYEQAAGSAMTDGQALRARAAARRAAEGG